MVGRRDQNRIDIFSIEHTAKIATGIGTVSAEFLNARCCLGGTRVVNVTCDDAINLGILQEVIQHVLATVTRTDNAEADFAIWRNFTRTRDSREGNWTGSERKCGRVQELAARELGHGGIKN
jgi:translation initiation factor 2 gamma subunit (eIF-2gamma)